MCTNFELFKLILFLITYTTKTVKTKYSVNHCSQLLFCFLPGLQTKKKKKCWVSKQFWNINYCKKIIFYRINGLSLGSKRFHWYLSWISSEKNVRYCETNSEYWRQGYNNSLLKMYIWEKNKRIMQSIICKQFI